jgi:HEAT repeat protein
MKTPLDDSIIKILMLISASFFAMLSFFPETPILLGITALLIGLNFIFSLVELFRKGTITSSLILLNIVQLALFCLLFLLIHDILGADNYTYADPLKTPNWLDWVTLVAVHVVRAMDIVDFLSDYNLFQFQNVSNASTLVGITLFAMHMMVDIFIVGAIVMLLSRRRNREQEPSRFQKIIVWLGEKLEWFMQFRLWILGGTFGIIILVAITNAWPLRDWFLWPLNEILRALDIGDLFEIFDWQIHNIDMNYKWGLIALAVFFRFLVSIYVLGFANLLYLKLLKGRGKTVDELVELCFLPNLSEPDKRIAVQALIKHASQAVEPLMNALDDNKSSDNRRIAIEILGEIGDVALDAVPKLVKALVDGNSGVRWAAAVALNERIDPQWPQNENIIDVIPDIEKALLEADSQIRRAAADTLGKIGPLAISTLPSLVKSLVDISSDVRYAANNALKKIDPQWWKNQSARNATNPLVKAVDNYSNVSRCAAAAITLEKLDPQWLSSESASQALPCLVKALATSYNAEIGRAIAVTLEKINPKWPQSEGAFRAIPYLIIALADSRESVRSIATEALHKIDPNAEKTVPSLVKARLGGNHELREIAKESFNALDKVYPKWSENSATIRTIPHLVLALIHKKKDIRIAANEVLTQIDLHWGHLKAAHRVIPNLVKALGQNDNEIRCSAIEALGKMGAAAAVTVPYLIKAQKEINNEQVHWAIQSSLNQIDPEGKYRKQ